MSTAAEHYDRLLAKHDGGTLAADAVVAATGFRPAIEGNLRQHPGEAKRLARAIEQAITRNTARAVAEQAVR